MDKVVFNLAAAKADIYIAENIEDGNPFIKQEQAVPGSTRVPLPDRLLEDLDEDDYEVIDAQPAFAAYKDAVDPEGDQSVESIVKGILDATGSNEARGRFHDTDDTRYPALLAVLSVVMKKTDIYLHIQQRDLDEYFTHPDVSRVAAILSASPKMWYSRNLVGEAPEDRILIDIVVRAKETKRIPTAFVRFDNEWLEVDKEKEAAFMCDDLKLRRERAKLTNRPMVTRLSDKALKCTDTEQSFDPSLLLVKTPTPFTLYSASDSDEGEPDGSDDGEGDSDEGDSGDGGGGEGDGGGGEDDPVLAFYEGKANEARILLNQAQTDSLAVESRVRKYWKIMRALKQAQDAAGAMALSAKARGAKRETELYLLEVKAQDNIPDEEVLSVEGLTREQEGFAKIYRTLNEIKIFKRDDLDGLSDAQIVEKMTKVSLADFIGGQIFIDGPVADTARDDDTFGITLFRLTQLLDGWNASSDSNNRVLRPQALTFGYIARLVTGLQDNNVESQMLWKLVVMMLLYPVANLQSWIRAITNGRARTFQLKDLEKRDGDTITVKTHETLNRAAWNDTFAKKDEITISASSALKKKAKIRREDFVKLESLWDAPEYYYAFTQKAFGFDPRTVDL